MTTNLEANRQDIPWKQAVAVDGPVLVYPGQRYGTDAARGRRPA